MRLTGRGPQHFSRAIRVSRRVAILMSLAGAAIRISFAATKLLLRQNYVCCDNIFLSRQNSKKTCFVGTKASLSRQKFVLRQIFVATKVCPDKNLFVVTKVLSTTVLSGQFYFLIVSTILFFVATKMILVAVPPMIY